MGALISRFRKKPTTMEQLKKIEDALRKIEDYKRNTERKQKRTVANLIISGAAVYILACVIVFVWYLPESWLVRLGLLVPLVLVPVIIYWMKRLISRYFQNKMTRANEDFSDLQRKKKDIIDSVMETETFNKAKEILSKYAPEQLEKKLQERIVPPATASIKTSTSDLRRRDVPSTTSPPPPRPGPLALQPVSNPGFMLQRISNSGLGIRPQLLHPIFPKERSFAEKLVEYIVGDGPSYRYALICKHCQGHNGMALKEEFNYIAFHCCYCTTFNSARRKRPLAPRLEQAEQETATPTDKALSPSLHGPKMASLEFSEAKQLEAPHVSLKTDLIQQKELEGTEVNGGRVVDDLTNKETDEADDLQVLQSSDEIDIENFKKMTEELVESRDEDYPPGTSPEEMLKQFIEEQKLKEKRLSLQTGNNDFNDEHDDLNLNENTAIESRSEFVKEDY